MSATWMLKPHRLPRTNRMDVFFLGIAVALVVFAVLLLLSRQAGSRFLALGLAFLSSMLVMTFTPVLWILTGRPSESYPELLGLLYGIPAGLGITLAGAVRFWLIRRRERLRNHLPG